VERLGSRVRETPEWINQPAALEKEIAPAPELFEVIDWTSAQAELPLEY
jgi:hypothetical protein